MKTLGQLKSLIALTIGVGTMGLQTARSAEWTPDPSIQNPEQHKRLYDIGRKYLDANFDPDADLIGTNSKHPPNKKQHGTRESAYYAYALLLTGDKQEQDLAQLILKKVVMTQDTSSDGLTRGAYGWIWEDKPVDLNSADFVGIALAQIVNLDRRRPCLDPDVRTLVENSLRLAVIASMRRDADPSYTNIALLTTALTAAGDKLLHMPMTAAFSEAKLDAVMKLADDSEYAEYLSPTYGAVDMSGAYLAKQFAFSDAFAAKAEANIDHLWKQFALSYHAPTDQLLGPFARSYGDNMLDYTAGLKYMLYLALNGDYPLPDTERDHDWDKAGLVTVCTLPITVRDEFKLPHPAWREFDSAGLYATRHLSQFRKENFALGTVATQDEWKQKRNLVAYWRNDDASAPNGFNVGYCIDESNETLVNYPGQYVSFLSHQDKGSAIVGLVAVKGVPQDPAGLSLVFDKSATATGGAGGQPLKVDDGTITTYIYSISGSARSLDGKADEKTFHVARPWNTADDLGTRHVLSYLIVFRPHDQPAPKVTAITLHGDTTGSFASAKVDGNEIRVSLDN